MRGAVAGGPAAGWRGSPAARYLAARARWLARLAFRLRRRGGGRAGAAGRPVAPVAPAAGDHRHLRGVLPGRASCWASCSCRRSRRTSSPARRTSAAERHLGRPGRSPGHRERAARSRAPTPGKLMYGIVSRLQATASSSGTDYAVFVTLPSSYQGPPVFSGGASVGFAGAPPPPPAALVARGRDGEPAERRHVRFVPAPDEPGRAAGDAGPGLRRPVRQRLPAVLLLPADREQTSLAQAQRTLLLVGLAVVVLLAGIAWLVTRWVVIPVRLAARGALRLSTGNLDERMVGPRLRRAGRPGHVVQPDGGQPAGEAAASWRTCPRCSGSSSRTSRMSCAPR